MNDYLNAAHKFFQNMSTAITKRFNRKDRVYDSFGFVGSLIETTADGSFSKLQEYYAQN